MAREVVEQIKCDVCGAMPATPYTIGRGNEQAHEIDLCAEHGKGINELYEYEKARPIGRQKSTGGPRTQRPPVRAARHAFEPVD